MRYLSLLLLAAIPAFAADLPEQAARGKDLFRLKSASGVACVTCHKVADEGAAIGPDLAIMGRLAPRAILTAILSTRTVNVKEISLPPGRTYPAIQSGDKWFDLSKTPPAEVTPTAAQISAARDNATWVHPPESRGLTRQQLADIIGYLRFVYLKDTKEIKPADLQ